MHVPCSEMGVRRCCSDARVSNRPTSVRSSLAGQVQLTCTTQFPEALDITARIETSAGVYRFSGWHDTCAIQHWRCIL